MKVKRQSIFHPDNKPVQAEKVKRQSIFRPDNKTVQAALEAATLFN